MFLDLLGKDKSENEKLKPEINAIKIRKFLPEIAYAQKFMEMEKVIYMKFRSMLNFLESLFRNVVLSVSSLFMTTHQLNLQKKANYQSFVLYSNENKII